MKNNPAGMAVAAVVGWALAISACWGQATRPSSTRPAPGERSASMTPEQRRAWFYDRAMERYMETISDTYGLKESQKEAVREELQKIRAEALEQTRERESEYRQVREQLEQAAAARRAGQPVDQQKTDALMQRVRDLRQSSPLLNPESVLPRIEKLLPEEQARAGRKQWESRRNARRDVTGRNAGEWGTDDAWRRYVEQFCEQYKLDPAQRGAAMSLLREYQEKRNNLRQSRSGEYEAARQITDPRKRRDRYRELNEPLVGLFDEMKGRLEQLPTPSQRSAYEATTRPAGTGGSRPAERG